MSICSALYCYMAWDGWGMGDSDSGRQWQWGFEVAFLFLFFFSPSQGGYRKQASVSWTIMTPLGYLWERAKKNESWKKKSTRRWVRPRLIQPSTYQFPREDLILNLLISPVRAASSVVAKGGLCSHLVLNPVREAVPSGKCWHYLRDLVCSEAILSTKGRLLKSSPGQQIWMTGWSIDCL